MQQRHIINNALGWNTRQAQKSAQEMFDRMFNMQFLPPGRGLWSMGSALTEERHLHAATNNCGYVSTLGFKEDPSKPFRFLMDMSMLGVGVGFDVLGAGEFTIQQASKSSTKPFVIEDTRESWVESVGVLLEAWFLGRPAPVFDYSKIRAAGEPIKGFGGTASGPEPLRVCHLELTNVLQANAGKLVSERVIVDIQNMIGKMVIAGNVRRTAEIAFGPIDSEEFKNLKNYKMNPERASYGWTSNNSVFAKVGMDYTGLTERIRDNGEPGFLWLENAQRYSRMNNGPDDKDLRVRGANPCVEQSLESYELCCLVETFLNRHETLDDFLRTLKFSYLYAKTVTLGKSHWSDTNRVMLRNRRIGCSVSGVAQFLDKHGIHELRKWLHAGYDEVQKWDETYSEWLVIPRSVKTTSVKPSGTVSLLAGASPGMHWPEDRYYIRRIRVSKGSPLATMLAKAGYTVEDDVKDTSSVVVGVPVDFGPGIRTIKEVSMWEQASMAAFLQENWSDNQVSATVTFDPKTEGEQIPHVLNYLQYKLKGISFLPRTEHGAFEQMPYESITEEEFRTLDKAIRKIRGKLVGQASEPERFCTTDTCEMKDMEEGQ